MARIDTKRMFESADEMRVEAAEAVLSGSGILAARLELAEQFLREGARQLVAFYKNEDEFQKHFAAKGD